MFYRILVCTTCTSKYEQSVLVLVLCMQDTEQKCIKKNETEQVWGNHFAFCVVYIDLNTEAGRQAVRHSCVSFYILNVNKWEKIGSQAG